MILSSKAWAPSLSPTAPRSYIPERPPLSSTTQFLLHETDSRAAFCQPQTAVTIPSSTPFSSVTIPLRTLASPSYPRNEHSAALLNSTSEKQGHRRSSDSAGSDFSLWSDTGDLAEQLADREDPLQINIRGSLENQTSRAYRPQGRQPKHVHYSDQTFPERKNTDRGIDKEAIQIPDPGPRTISRTEQLLAILLTGNRESSKMSGLTGKPLLLVQRLCRRRTGC